MGFILIWKQLAKELSLIAGRVEYWRKVAVVACDRTLCVSHLLGVSSGAYVRLKDDHCGLNQCRIVHLKSTKKDSEADVSRLKQLGVEASPISLVVGA